MIEKRFDVSAGNMRNLGDITIAALQEARVGISDKERIKQHPGKGSTILDFGLHRLEERAAALGVAPELYASIEQKAREQFAKGAPLCESPIERAMLAALITWPWAGLMTLPAIVHNGADKSEMLPVGDVVIIPQFAFARYRMDFGIVVEVGRVRRIVCVECDGAQYHTDYVKEFSRMAYFGSWEIPVFKFTGSQIHEDAIAAADEVINAICQWRANQ